MYILFDLFHIFPEPFVLPPISPLAIFVRQSKKWKLNYPLFPMTKLRVTPVKGASFPLLCHQAKEKLASTCFYVL